MSEVAATRQYATHVCVNERKSEQPPPPPPLLLNSSSRRAMHAWLDGWPRRHLFYGPLRPALFFPSEGGGGGGEYSEYSEYSPAFEN